MHLQCAQGRDQHHRVGGDAGLATLDVEELLGSEVGPEPGLGDDVVGELERGPGCDDRVAPVGDVRERPAVDDGGVVLQRLHQVRSESVLEQHRHRAVGLQIARGDRLPSARLSDHDIAEAALQVVQIGGKAEDRHHLGGDGDVEAVAAREPVADAAERADDLAQRPIVHVHDAPPGDPPGVEPERIALVDVIVEERRQQVVRGADGMEIAGEMQVDVLHRHHLRVAAAGGSALYPEAGTEARLAQADQRLLSDAVQAVGEPDGCGRLAFAGRGGGNRRDQHELSVLALGERIDVAEIDLRLRVSIRQQCLEWNLQSISNLRNRLLHRLPGNLDVTLGQRLFLRAGSWWTGDRTRAGATPSLRPCFGCERIPEPWDTRAPPWMGRARAVTPAGA